MSEIEIEVELIDEVIEADVDVTAVDVTSTLDISSIDGGTPSSLYDDEVEGGGP